MHTVVDEDGTTRGGSLLDEVVREGARRMPAAALEAEISSCIAKLANEKDETGGRAGARFEHGRLVERPEAAAV
ncbi:hypothetical protein [Actinacidiphila sp. bgisy167]|uniref:hypothetical protein n=1 Tax=Actinacidiphila sp. bgisy167 TaxID=3413797 RepID=UPI003D736DF6